MKKCPRCGGTMLQDFSDVREGFHRTWKCVSCGRELFLDPARQAEDERFRAMLQERRDDADAQGP